jgi:hypothetical protein
MIKLEETLRRMSVFEDSKEVAEGVYDAADTYWNKEAGVHIDGLWRLCNELVAQIELMKEQMVELEIDLDELTYKGRSND